MILFSEIFGTDLNQSKETIKVILPTPDECEELEEDYATDFADKNQKEDK